ncbi:MAG: efflux RND transporter periplasmic adaptor subunit [Cetobacterium sp.]
MKKKWIMYLTVSTILILVFLYFYFRSTKIDAVKVKKQDYTEKILVTGTIQAKNFSILTSGINGVIENIYIREGQPVTKGSIVAKLNTQEIEADIAKVKALYEKSKYDLEVVSSVSLENAKAQLKSAQINYDISKREFLDHEKLYQKKYISRLEFDSKKQEFINSEKTLKDAQINFNTFKNEGASYKSALENTNSAKNNLKSLENNLSKYYICAPYDGFITVRNVEVGQTVAPYTEMFQISSSDEKIVSINLDEKYINKVTFGSPIKIYPYADTSKFSSGNIYYIGINVDEINGTLEVRGDIDETLPEFLFNSTVNTIIQGESFKDAVLLQGVYTVQKKNKTYVYILKNDKSKLVEVQGVPVIDGFVVISGLENDDIVLSPKNITENIRVTPIYES